LHRTKERNGRKLTQKKKKKENAKEKSALFQRKILDPKTAVNKENQK